MIYSHSSIIMVNQFLISFSSFANTDSNVANQMADAANEDIQKYVASKQWKKVDEASSKLSMAIAANKRATSRLEVLHAKRKKLS